MLADWEAFLAVPGSDDTTAENTARPMGAALAGMRIYKWYRRIAKDGKCIHKYSQDALLAIAAGLPIDDPQTRRTLVATGALVEALRRRQEEVKLRFADIFTAFAAPAVRKMVRSSFGSESKARMRKV